MFLTYSLRISLDVSAIEKSDFFLLSFAEKIVPSSTPKKPTSYYTNIIILTYRKKIKTLTY